MKEDLIIDGCAFTETEFTGVTEDVLPVSYTHLDVYKRQTGRRWSETAW